MTLSTPPPSHDGKDAWHWLGLAISLSYSLGLNRGPAQPNSTLRKKRLERRIWWSTFVRDRTLALSTKGTWARAVRIRREDCDVEMLSLTDFDLDDDENKDSGVDEVRARQNAKACVEKAILCWCSNDTLVTSMHQLTHLPQPQKAPPHILSPQQHILEVSQLGDHAYNTASSYASAPVFENPEDASYRMASSSSPSVRSDCPTPHEEALFDPPVEEEGLMDASRNGELDGGYGVDGEYDDYLEYLKPTSTVEGVERKEKGRETWAFQLDCENNRVLEV